MAHTLGQQPAPQDRDAIVAELGDLRRRVDALCAELDRTTPTGSRSSDQRGATDGGSAPLATSRRRMLHLAGASAIGAVGGAIAVGQPAAAADPNDVVKNVPNPVDDTTTLDGGFPGPVLSLFNRGDAETSAGLYVYSEAAAPTLRVDNDSTSDAVAVAGNAPAGRDLHATGSGRIAMDDHDFGGGNTYGAGELHQSGGTLYAMVTEAVRRVVAAPAAAGALFPINPIRVYDSRVSSPFFGPIAAGQVRTLAIDDGRDRVTGAVVQPNAVPGDATAIVFNLTVARTSGRGFLSVTPEPDTNPSTSTVNWGTDDAVVANSSLVGLGAGGNVSVYCGGVGSTDFIVDVVGYYH